METLSFVIPCYNSSATVPGVIGEIEHVMAERPSWEFEIITVVDGSPDDVFGTLSALARDDRRLKVVELSKNFGQANALMAGYNYASGDVTVTLDDDGQCPIDHVWELIRPVVDGEADMSVARYPVKKQSFVKNVGSALNGFMARTIMGFPKDFEMSNFYAFDRLVRDQVIAYKNPYPYLSGLAFSATRRIVNVPMEERERVAGTTNYTMRKLINLWLSGFTSFSVAPLRIADVLGLTCAFIGFVYGAYIVIRRLAFNDIMAGYASLLAVLLFIGGVIMILLGLIGEYVGRIFICINQSPQYIVRETLNFDGGGREPGRSGPRTREGRWPVGYNENI